MPQLNKTTRERIIELLKEGKSCSDVANQVRCSKASVGRLRQTLPDIGRGSKVGRKSKLTPRDKRQIVHDMTNGIAKTTKQVAAALNDSYGISVTPQTVRNVLQEAGVKTRKLVKKPALTSRHRKRRLEFALKHKEWTIEDWKKALWSDETKINRICSDGIQYKWRINSKVPTEKEVVPKPKFCGGNIMI